MIICIDPGHGGSDPGAVGKVSTEKDNSLSICLKLRSLLEYFDHEVIMTRDTDKDVAYPGASASVELQARCDISNNANADLFLSVHCNSYSNPGAHGTETFYMEGSTKGSLLAQYIHGELVGMGLTNRGTKTAGFKVLRSTDAPAALVELAFISNPEEEAMLADENMQEAFAEAICRGIQNYGREV